MAIPAFLGSNYGIIGSIVVGLIVLYILFRILGKSGWSRAKQENIELGEERDLEKTTIEEKKLQRQEKKIVKKLINNLKIFLENYVLLWNSSESTSPRKTERGQATLSPAEIVNALQIIILKLKKIEKEDIPLKSEESFFSKLVEYWGFVHNEIGKWSFVPNQGKSSDFEKGLSGMRETELGINDFMKQLGADLKLEEQLDESKKREILELYQQTLKEVGVQT